MPLAYDVKKSLPSGSKLLVGSVGGIKNGKFAQEVLEQGKADVVLVGSQFLKNPASVWAFAEDLGVDIYLPNQIEWGKLRLRVSQTTVTDASVRKLAFKGRGSLAARGIQG